MDAGTGGLWEGRRGFRDRVSWLGQLWHMLIGRADFFYSAPAACWCAMDAGNLVLLVMRARWAVPLVVTLPDCRGPVMA